MGGTIGGSKFLRSLHSSFRGVPTGLSPPFGTHRILEPFAELADPRILDPGTDVRRRVSSGQYFPTACPDNEAIRFHPLVPLRSRTFVCVRVGLRPHQPPIRIKAVRSS